jgi:hypothetical protein
VNDTIKDLVKQFLTYDKRNLICKADWSNMPENLRPVSVNYLLESLSKAFGYVEISVKNDTASLLFLRKKEDYEKLQNSKEVGARIIKWKGDKIVFNFLSEMVNRCQVAKAK